MFDTFFFLVLALDRNQQMFGVFAGTLGVIWILVMLALFIFSIYCLWRVAEKCGYPGAYGLLILIPLVNIIVELIWIFSEWPIESELKRLRASTPTR